MEEVVAIHWNTKQSVVEGSNLTGEAPFREGD